MNYLSLALVRLAEAFKARVILFKELGDYTVLKGKKLSRLSERSLVMIVQNY